MNAEIAIGTSCMFSSFFCAVTTDPGVAAEFNSTPLIRNRLFEQEYFDVERVEVLRGPQGTLYGRNATAGVINLITAKPDMNEFKGWMKGEVGNYHAKRLSAMVNVPLVQDKLAIRFAGALTDRAGYDYNTGTHHAVNGRDLWSGRITVGFNPTDRIRTSLVWERFNEDDNRSRTGKQLCHRDDGLDSVDGVSTVDHPTPGVPDNSLERKTLFSQGCKPGSLYDPAAFGTPNGLAIPFVWGLLEMGSFYALNTGYPKTLLDDKDPYGGAIQSRDLRVIDSIRDPIYRASADVVQLNVNFDLSDAVSVTSQTVYDADRTYSFQDYNRFNTVPIFNDTSNFIVSTAWAGDQPTYQALAPGGVFCDPQVGCSRSMVTFDIAKAKAKQFTEEFRIQSHHDGNVNFSAGINYTRFQALIDYFVINNLMSAYAMTPPFNAPLEALQTVSMDKCFISGDRIGLYGVWPIGDPASGCPYIDPNPVESIDGEGHNYFRSKNPYKLKSAAAFAEMYWDIQPAVRVTAGLRYTDDKKTFIPVPTQVLLGRNPFAAGYANKGYPELPPIKQHWGEWTGRLGVDWKPDISWTDQTLVYAFYSRGYKGGGANPPGPGFDTRSVADWIGVPKEAWIGTPNERYTKPQLVLPGIEYSPVFKPEFVNAFEVGSKNTLLGGGMSLNGSAFFYDYRDYQVSQIRNRTAVNENFDAKVWGLELESMFAPSRDLQIVANLGYLDTRIGNGESSIDVMNRTQGNPDYVLAKPWPQLPSNCIVPAAVAAQMLSGPGTIGFMDLCGGANNFARAFSTGVRDPATGQDYDPANYPEINGGSGILAQLGGNELPNAPHWTMNLGAQYGFDFLEGWRGTIRADGYWQSQSWARVYNAVNDKLHGWYNANLSVWIERPEDGLKVELYAKNILDKTPITDAFINSDDSALTTNVFVLDPRLIGLSIRKEF
ncbi:MAG: TonB-dependent receptor [Parcubacteria group bacterium]